MALAATNVQTGGLAAAANDDFYAVPVPLPAGDPGTVVRSERITAPDGARAWRVL